MDYDEHTLKEDTVMPAARIRHKHLRLNQHKLDRVRKVLRCKSEREAIEGAMDFVLAEDEILKTLRRVKGKGRIKRLFV
jgi:hypothetical protein